MTSASEIAISARELTKTFGSIRAVNGLSLEVKAGEILGFLGPNGAGKSTTIRMLCGIFTPSEGSGSVDGLDIVSQTESIKHRIGYMLLRTWTIMWKECIQIRRDPRLLTVAIAFPLLLLIIYGYAINLDVKHLRIAIRDLDRSFASRECISVFSNSEYFDVREFLQVAMTVAIVGTQLPTVLMSGFIFPIK